MKKVLTSAIVGLILLVAPWFLRIAPAPLSSYGAIAVAYLVVCLVVSWARFELKDFATAGIWVYSIAGLAAVGMAAIAGSAMLAVVSLVIALVAYRLSFLEKWTGLVFVSIGGVYIGVSQLVPLNQWANSGFAAVLMMAGIVVFALGQIVSAKDPERGVVMRQAGLVGPFLGCIVGLAAGDQSQITIVALAVGGGVLFAEGYIEGSTSTEEIAGAIIIAAYEWLLASAGAQMVYAYTLPWVIYFAYLAHVRKEGSLGRDVMTGLALAALTFPIVVQSVSAGGDIYGLELVLAGLVMAVIGSVQLNSLVLWWGTGTVLIEGAYIATKYLAPDSNGSLIAGATALVIFAVAVMVHLSHESDGAGET